MTWRHTAPILALLTMIAAPATTAQVSQDAEPTPRIYTVSVYGWLMALEGDFHSSNGTEYEITVPFGEIFSRLDSVLQASLEVDVDRWYLIFDCTWAKLAGGYDATAWAIDVELDQQIYDLKVGYDLFRRVESDSDRGEPSGWVRVSTVDLLLGARYFGSQTTTTETTKLTGNTNVFETKVSRWDPVIGARGSFAFSRRWALDVIADLGGFGIGNAAEFTYQLDASMAYWFSPLFSAFAGYRTLGYSLETDSGGENWITQHGPRVGVAFSF